MDQTGRGAPQIGQTGTCFPEVRLELDLQGECGLVKRGGGRNGVKLGQAALVSFLRQECATRIPQQEDSTRGDRDP